jgi:hypothetical protein
MAVLLFERVSITERTKAGVRTFLGRVCRHGALALIAWYLMVPAWAGLDAFDSKAPLLRWYQAADFDSFKKCDQYRANKVAKMRMEAAPHNSKESVRAGTIGDLYEH